MRRAAITFVVAALFLTVGCRNKSKEPNLTLTASPYHLEISNFNWSYGLIEFNKFEGDFETLDQRAFDLLKGKMGSCTVKLEQSQTDKYGKTSLIYVNIGTIDLTELSKYENWQYWHNTGGIQKLLYSNLFHQATK